jgi:integrase
MPTDYGYRISCHHPTTSDALLIGLLIFTFTRIGAALGMNMAELYWQHRRLWVRLHEKGGEEYSMPRHHNLESYLLDYIETASLAAGNREAPLFKYPPSFRRAAQDLKRRPRTRQ